MQEEAITPDTEILEIKLGNGVTLGAKLDDFMSLPPVAARVQQAIADSESRLAAETERASQAETHAALLLDESKKAHATISRIWGLYPDSSLPERAKWLCAAWSDHRDTLQAREANHRVQVGELKTENERLVEELRVLKNKQAVAGYDAKYWYGEHQKGVSAAREAGFRGSACLDLTKAITDLASQRDEAQAAHRAANDLVDNLRKQVGDLSGEIHRQHGPDMAKQLEANRALKVSANNKRTALWIARMALPVGFRLPEKTVAQNIADFNAEYIRIKDELLKLKESGTSSVFIHENIHHQYNDLKASFDTLVFLVKGLEDMMPEGYDDRSRGLNKNLACLISRYAGLDASLGEKSNALNELWDALPAGFKDRTLPLQDNVRSLARVVNLRGATIDEKNDVLRSAWDALPAGFGNRTRTLARNIEELAISRKEAIDAMTDVRKKSQEIEASASTLESVAWGIYDAIGREIGIKKVTEPIHLNGAVREAVDYWKDQVAHLVARRSELLGERDVLRAENEKLKTASELAVVIDGFYNNKQMAVIPDSGTD